MAWGIMAGCLATLSPRRIPVSKKVFIKTFGCQMNEYDSAKMLDVLGASEEMSAPTPRKTPTSFCSTPVRCAKKPGKVFSDLGRVRELKLQRPDLVIGVGGCVASQEGGRLSNARPLSMWCLARKPCTACRTCCARAARQLVTAPRWIFPSRNRKIRPSAASAGGRRRGVCLHHGRLLEILHLLRGALYPWRRSLASAGRCAGGNRRPGATGVKKSPCWARTSTPIAA